MEIRVAIYPQLRELCWNRPADTVLDGEEALGLYERNWRFVAQEALGDEERALLDLLVKRYGNGVLNVWTPASHCNCQGSPRIEQ